MGFFDFLGDLEKYKDNDKAAIRMNKRRQFLIEPYKDEIKGAKVLDLAAHDGRWCYAFAGAGAKSVLGIEARQELVDMFEDYPDPKLTKKVTLRVNDLYDGVDEAIADGETYDVVGVFGVLFHLMDHSRLFQRLRILKPKLVLVDSEFMLRPGAMVQLIREKTDNPLNAAPQYEGQEVAVKGIPSFKAMEVIADCLNYDLEWADWNEIGDDRTAVQDYFRKDGARRATCALRLRDR